MSLYKFWTYFFPLCEKEVSFSNFLTRANHTRPCFFANFYQAIFGPKHQEVAGCCLFAILCSIKFKTIDPKLSVLVPKMF